MTNQLAGFTHQVLTNHNSWFSSQFFSHQVLTNHNSRFSSLISSHHVLTNQSAWFSSDQSGNMVQPSYPDQSEDMVQTPTSISSHQQKYLTFQYKRRASLPSNILTHSSRGTHSPELNHPVIQSTYHITPSPIHPYISLLVSRKERTITLIHWCVLNQAFHKSLSYLYIRYPSWLKVKEGDIKPE